MPDTTPRRNPTTRLSRRLLNKLPCPHSCIRPKTRTVSRMIGNNGTVASQGDIAALRTAAHHRRVKGTKVVRTCFSPLMSSDLVYRPIMAPFWRLKQSFDITMERPPAFPRIVFMCPRRVRLGPNRTSMFLGGVQRQVMRCPTDSGCDTPDARGVPPP